MKKLTNIAALMTLMLVFTFAIITSSYANQSGEGELTPEQAEKKVEMEAKMAEFREKMEGLQAVLEAGDYSAWAALLEESKHGEKILEQVTEDNFARYAEAKTLIKEGRENIREGHEMLKEMGIKGYGFKKGFKRWHGKGFKKGRSFGRFSHFKAPGQWNK